jgi:hypothetical protein
LGFFGWCPTKFGITSFVVPSTAVPSEPARLVVPAKDRLLSVVPELDAPA